jgi:hypothetical protein
MGRRYGKASVANVQAIEAIIEQVGSGFVPTSDPFQELAREIEVRKSLAFFVSSS